MYGTYIFNNVIDETFKSLEHELEKRNLTFVVLGEETEEKLLNMKIEVISAERAKEFKLVLPFSFSITGKEEFQYARSLLKIYNTTIKPFLDTNRELIEKSAGINFGMVFFATSDLSNLYGGKTIHNTRRSLDNFLH